MQNFPSLALKSWFKREKRSLPWRENPTGYSVLVSEVMLQQTQAATVEPYYIRWMRKFPTLQDLAYAEEQVLLKAWEGLGYYSRARNLQKAARYIVENLQGIVPEDVESLKALPGIGPYTAAAIASFAFNKKALPIDGNVLRVASRLFMIKEPINTPRGYKAAYEKLKFVLEDSEPWIIGEALIELGATVCGKKPSCFKCPLEEVCLAKKEGDQLDFPVKKKLQETIFLEREVLILFNEGSILLSKQKEKGIMKGLFEFPYYEKGGREEFKKRVNADFSVEKELKPLTQSFTRFRVTLYPYIGKIDNKINFKDFTWVGIEEASLLPFSSAHKKILTQIKSLL